MKKSLFILLISALLVTTALTGCAGNNPPTNSSSQSTSEVSNAQSGTVAEDSSSSYAEDYTVEETVANNEATVANSSNFDADKIVKKIKVTPYTYDTDFSHYFVAVLKNDSDQECQLTMSVDLLDKKGNIVGTDERTIDAFAPGTEVALTFSCDDKFAKYEYTLNADELTYYQCVTQNLECKVSTATDKAIISAKNTGDIPAQYVQYTAMFFKGDKLVDTTWGYIDDNDSEIKPGKTQKEEASCYEKFESVKVYLDGRAFDY